MRHTVWFLTLFASILSVSVASAQSDAEIVAEINRHIAQAWKDNGVEPSPRADDGEYARRTSLDVAGTIPPLPDLLEMLGDESEQRRAKFVDKLLDDGRYADNWANIWANLLIGRANRRNQGVRDDVERYLKGAFTRNLAYDKFVFELISATGNSDQNGAAGFLASHLNDNAVPATAITARVFLGLQVQCTQCHNHPFNDWKQSQFWSMNAFFRGTRRQNVNGRNTVNLSDTPAETVVFFEKRNGTMEASLRRFVDGSPPSTATDQPRTQLALLMTSDEQPYLSQAIVNRMWGHFLGTGFTRPVDDMGPHNPPSHPELLTYLAGQFRTSGYDLKRLIRWITLSDAYNLTSRATAENKDDDPATGGTPMFTHVLVKPFTAEQLYDSLLVATSAHKAGRNFQQSEQKRGEWLGQFVQAFGTDENDETSSFNGTVPQALVLMNGELVRSAIAGEKGSFLRTVYDGDLPEWAAAKKSKPLKNLPSPKTLSGKIEVLYLTALSRRPSAGEIRTLESAYQRAGGRNPVAAFQDVYWAILNSNEFILNH
jgi:hypothetical protein